MHCVDQDETLLKAKVTELANRLYPSISSFPVCKCLFFLSRKEKLLNSVIDIILQNLQEHLTPDFAFNTLVEAGVPSEVVSDAKEAISSY